MKTNPENRRTRRARHSRRKSPVGRPMRYPQIGPPVPVGYINIEEWGIETGRGRVAAYAAAGRGEVEVEELGVMCIREDWRERNAARAAKEAEERRRQYREQRAQRRRPSDPDDGDADHPETP